MSNSKRIQTVVLSSLIVSMAITPSAHARNRRDYVSQTGEIVGGALVVGGIAAGLYAVGSWLFGTTDEQVIDQARNAHYDAKNRYTELINMLPQAAGTPGNAQQYLASEETLEKIAHKIFSSASTFDQFSSDLKYIRNSLQSQRKELFKRASKRNSAFMYDIVNDIDATLDRLAALHHFVKHHQAYFNLDYAERCTFARYKQECEFIEKYGTNLTELNHQLRGAIARYGSSCNCAYPYLDYVERLKNDKQALDSHRAVASGRYMELGADATRLSSYIDLMIREITADPEYMRSLRDRERDYREQIERERRMALERERIRLEQEARRQQDIIIAQQREAARQRELIIAQQREREYELRRAEERERDRIRLERERELLALEHQAYCRPHAEFYVEFELND